MVGNNAAPRLVDRFGNTLRRDIAGGNLGKRRAYEGANSGNTNFHYWKDATGQNFNSALQADKQILTNRIQHENRNNSFLKGIARKYANFIIGEGPLAQILCEDDEEWAEDVQVRFKRWSNNCNYRRPATFSSNIRGGSLTGILRLAVMGLFDFGEYLIVQQTDPTETGHNKMKLLLINPRRLRCPDGTRGRGDAVLCNGIEFDKKGKPLRYWITDQDANRQLLPELQKATIMDARLVIHDFVEENPDQVRGEPWLAQALNTAAKLRRFQESTLGAAEMQALLAAFLVCTNPELVGELVERDSQGNPLLPEFKEDLEPGTLTTAPIGYDLKNISPSQPSAQYGEYVQENKAETSSGTCDMPNSVASSDTSRSNFASGKIDRQDFSVNLDSMRHNNLEERNINRVFDMWLMEEMLIPVGKGGLRAPKNDCPWSLSWIWRRNANFLDEQKKAKSRSDNLQNHIEVLSDIWMEDGKDPKDMMAKIIAQNNWMDKNDLDFKDAVSVTENISIEGEPENG